MISISIRAIGIVRGEITGIGHGTIMKVGFTTEILHTM